MNIAQTIAAKAVFSLNTDTDLLISFLEEALYFNTTLLICVSQRRLFLLTNLLVDPTTTVRDYSHLRSLNKNVIPSPI